MRLSNTTLALGVALAAAIVSVSAKADQVKLAVFQIPQLAESKDKGVFIDFMKEVIKRSGLDVDFDVFPGQRAIASFYTQERHVIGPILAIALKGEFHRSSSFFQKQDYVFVKKGSPPINDLKGLEGKRVGLTTAYEYPPEVQHAKSFTVDPAASDVLNMKKLEAGRIDAFIVEGMSGMAAAIEAGVADKIEKSPTPLYSLDVFYAFNATPHGKAASEAFTKAIDSMAQDGTLKRIFAAP